MADIRAGLIANLSTIPNVQWSPYMLASPTPPAGHIIPGGIDYDEAMHRGYDATTMTVQVFVGLVTDQGSQVVLDQYLASSGINSVKAAIESDITLGGKVSACRVTNASPFQVITLSERQVLTVSWTVYVIS